MVKKIKNTPFWNVLRRGSALTLALIVVISTCILPTFAADEPTEPTEPVYSEGLAYTYNSANMTATVTGRGDWTGSDLRVPPSVLYEGASYSVVAVGGFSSDLNLLSVYLSAPVVTVNASAFSSCTALMHFQSESTVVINSYAFSNCTNLSQFDFSKVSSFSSNAFDECGIRNLVIPNTFGRFSLNDFGRLGYLETITYSYPTVLTYTNKTLRPSEAVYYNGTTLQFLSSITSTVQSSFFTTGIKLYINNEFIEGRFVVPEGSNVNVALRGYSFIDELVVPSLVSFDTSVSYEAYFGNMSALKTVYWYAFGGWNASGTSDATFNGCANLENVYYFGDQTSFTKNNIFYSTNDNFTLYLPGASDQYTLTGFTNPIVYNSAYVNLEATGLYTDDPLIFQKGSLFSMTLKTVFGYGLPGTVDVLDSAGESLGWTNGVQYFYDSTNGSFSVPDLQDSITVVALGVSLVPNYYFYNANPAFQSFVGDQFTFEATDFNGSAVTGAFIRLEDERLCFYQIVAEEDVLAWADDTGWVSPLYRYLDFGSYEVGEDLAYFLRTTASVPSIGSMLSQIYNASGGGSSGGSYEDGYDEGYQTGFDDGRDVGYDEGYDVGFQDGSAVSGGGSSPGTTGTIFDYCTFFVTFNIRNNAGNVTTTDRIQIEPTMGVGTIDPSGAIGARYALVDLPGQTVVGCTFYMVWTDLHFFDYTTFPIFVTGEEAPSLSAKMMNVENQSFALVPSLRDGSDGLYVLAPMYVDTYPESKNCTEIRMDVATPQFWGVTISTNAEMYSVGYGQGYGEGFQKGSATSSEQAYNEGVRNGYITGKQEGIQISEKGNFYNLFVSVSDAVFGSFLSLFNFEILGVNMQTIFGALLTLCVLLIVLFKFTGKKE